MSEQFKVWAAGSPEDFAELVEAYSFENAAYRWAVETDCHNAHQIARGDDMEVWVFRVSNSQRQRRIISGELEPTYWSKEVKE